MIREGGSEREVWVRREGEGELEVKFGPPWIAKANTAAVYS